MGSNQRHQKLVKHYHEPGDLHELTFSCHHRLPLLSNDELRARLASCINEAGQQTGIELSAFVFMPEHVHLLVAPTTSNPDLGRYLALVKQPFSKFVKQHLIALKSPLVERLTVRERPGTTCFRFWQEGPGFDRNLNTARSIEAAIDYIHRNPARRDLTTCAVDWKWSSARWYLLDPPRQHFPGLPLISGLPTGTLDPS